MCTTIYHVSRTTDILSVRVEVDAREPPSQLQEALKESTKVDAEYNLPTWVPKTRDNMTKRRIPGVDLRVHHVLPRVPHNVWSPS